MNVVVSRNGGFAGLRHTWTVEIDQQPDEREWEGLLARLPWDSVSPAASPRPDRFVYEIRVSSRSIRLSETQLDGPWRELVDRVKEAQRP